MDENICLRKSDTLSFPCSCIHYIELLKIAYCSDNPVQTLQILLDPYDIEMHHIEYLLKYIFSKVPANGLLAKDLEESKCNINESNVARQSRFIYIATSVCHLWYHKRDDKRHYYLVPHAPHVTYITSNVPIGYIWINIDGTKGTIKLMKHTCMQEHKGPLRICSRWKWPDEGGDATQRISINLATGYSRINTARGTFLQLMICVTMEGILTVTVPKNGGTDRGSYVLILTHTQNKLFHLDQIYYNDATLSTVTPIIAAMHRYNP